MSERSDSQQRNRVGRYARWSCSSICGKGCIIRALLFNGAFRVYATEAEIFVLFLEETLEALSVLWLVFWDHRPEHVFGKAW
jgi:hypothetical protein